MTSGLLAAAGETAVGTAVAERFVGFALDPSDDPGSTLRFTPEVRLGLGSELVIERPGPALHDDQSWLLDTQEFRGYLGPFSALRLIRHHAEDMGSATVDGPRAAFELTDGASADCVGNPRRVPPTLASLHRVSVQPSAHSRSTCLLWFSIDLFLDDEGRVAAVTLDLWEP
ncbi:hypothetical protein ACLM5J_11180 [Nocardioides sp. Bht2]|uniref:hypothetical protein n=1 Tax=Nocardioides sp. Bht2 TaxID=3392297 RepID=UPI0039B46B32